LKQFSVLADTTTVAIEVKFT